MKPCHVAFRPQQALGPCRTASPGHDPGPGKVASGCQR